MHDRTFVEQMKADILRRAEEIAEAEEEEETLTSGHTGANVIRPGVTSAIDEDDLDGDALGTVKVIGGGEESEGNQSEGDGDEDEEPAPARQAPQAILELAYIRDPKLFDRDGQTRRSKSRADLKALTGV